MSSLPVGTVCTSCGEELFDEELGPNLSRSEFDGGVICDECDYDQRKAHEFVCHWCGADEHEDFKDVLLISEECGGLDTGVYLIIDWPYFTSNYFDMWWNTNCLRRIGDVPRKFEAHDDYPSGHLCERCKLRATNLRLVPMIGAEFL